MSDSSESSPRGQQGRIGGLAAERMERLRRLAVDHKDELWDALAHEIEQKVNESIAVEEAERRVAWTQSPERRSFALTFWFIGALFPVFVVVGILCVKFFVPSPNQGTYLVGASTAVFIWFFCGYFAAITRYTTQRRSFKDRMLLEGERAELVQAEGEVASNDTDFPSLWNVTQKRLDYYHRIATTQSEQSFLYGQIAAGAGFAIVVLSIIVAAFARSTAASISSAVSGISGGGLGAFIGATFMRSQDTASIQLRQYFNQPLDFSKYLAAERLLEQLEGSDRSAAIQKMIEAIVGTSPSGENS